MFIPIPVPVSTRRIASVLGMFWKVVDCERCGTMFAYQVELEGTGEDHDLLFLDARASAERARAKAEENLVRKSRNVVVPVPCPHCGHYQAEMAERLKEDAWTNPLQFVGASIAVISFIPLALPIAYNWALPLVAAPAGLLLMTYGYMVAFRFDPNAGDPEPRMALGRSQTIWGSRLAEVLGAKPTPQPEPDDRIRPVK
jgi:hypothetical protein